MCIGFDQILVGWVDSNLRNLHAHSTPNVTASILRLEKKIAELQMQLLQEQLITVRDVWKEKVKALGEPDPDAPAKGNGQKQN